MTPYVELINRILANGKRRGDRTGTGTISLFGEQVRFNLRDGFPLLTLKQTNYKAVAAELVWFLEGSTDNERLHELGAKIWDEWALSKDFYEERELSFYERCELLATKLNMSKDQARKVLRTKGDIKAGIAYLNSAHIPKTVPKLIQPKGALGPIYGHQWRTWTIDLNRNIHIDQLKDLVRRLKNNPMSRRHIVSAWNPIDLPDETETPEQNVLLGRMALAPCHTLWQCYVEELTIQERMDIFNKRREYAGLQMTDTAGSDPVIQHELLDKLGIKRNALSLQLYQRSADMFLGVPFNIASYATLIHLLANECGFEVGDLIIAFGDVHIYTNHLDQVKEMLTRLPYDLPTLNLPVNINIANHTVTELVGALTNYNTHPYIKADVAI